MNKKLYLFLIFTLFVSKVFAYQTWIDFNVLKRLSKTQFLEINQEIEFDKGLKEVFWYQIQAKMNQELPLPGTSVVSNLMVLYRNVEPSNQWIFEIQPSIFAKQELTIPFFKFFFEEGLLLRIPLQKERVRVSPVVYGGIVLLESSFYTLFVANETDFNYFGYGRLDITYFYANLSLKLLNKIIGSLYYVFYTFKASLKDRWIPNNAIGIALSLQF